jgi:hypothetical protein
MGNSLTVCAFLKRHRNEGFCDDCIEKHTGVDSRQVDTIGSTLALFPAEFDRTEQVCPQGCGGREKPVTTAL